jgi:hypothetical protein
MSQEVNKQPSGRSDVNQLRAIVEQQSVMVHQLQQQVSQLQQQVHTSSTSSVNLKPGKPNTFNGQRKYDVDAWLSEVERYFKACGILNVIADERCVPYAVTILRGDASIWWESNQIMIREEELEPVVYWYQFQDAIRTQFQAANKSQTARDELSKLSQKKSVLAYTAEFNRLCIRIDNLHYTEKLDRYIRGLKPAIRIEVKKIQPKLFGQAVSIAEQIDNILFENGPKINFKSSSTFIDRADYQGTVPMEVGNIDAASDNEGERDEMFGNNVQVNKLAKKITFVTKRILEKKKKSIMFLLWK